MNEIKLYTDILYWLFSHDTDKNRNLDCYITFCDKVSNKKELAEFIKNYAIL